MDCCCLVFLVVFAGLPQSALFLQGGHASPFIC